MAASDQALPQRVRDRVCPVAEMQLAQDVRDVGLDGLLADVELPGDLGVAVRPGQRLQHLTLASGQPVQLRGQCDGVEGVGEPGDVPAHAVERAIQLSKDKYCSVWHSLRQDIDLLTSFEVVPAA